MSLLMVVDSGGRAIAAASAVAGVFAVVGGEAGAARGRGFPSAPAAGVPDGGWTAR